MRHEEVHSEVAASLSTLLETTADLWAALDLDLRLRLFNRAFEQYIQNTYGVLPKAGMLPEHFLPAQATAGWPQLIARALEIGSFQSRHTLADGRSLDLSFHPILSAGKITGISVFGKDITEQVAAEAALLQTEQRYRSILDGAVEGVFQLSAAGALLYANRAFLETFGFATVEEMQAAFPALLRMAWINQAERLEFSRRLKQEGFLHGFECRLRRWDGTSFWASVSARNVMDREGRVLSMEGFVEDISPRRQMLAEMTEHEERFRATFEQAAIGIQHSSFEGRILRCNRRFAEMIGYPIEEIVGRTFMQFTWPEDLAESERRIRLLNDGIAPSVSFEKRYRRKDDSPTWVRLTVSTQHDGHGIPLHYITFVEDINEQKAAKLRLTAATEALWASEVRYRTAFHTSLDAIAITRLEDGSIVDVNQTYLDTYGYRRDELIGHSVLDCNIWVNPADRHSMVDEVNRSGFCHDVEFRFRRKNGEIFWARFSNTRIELDGIPSLLCVLRDISDRKAAEERMTAAADALRASETRYRTAFQTSNDSMAISRLETGEVVDVNQAFLHIHGYQSREEVVGRSGLELQLWANPQDRSKLIAALRRDSTCRDMEFQFRRKNGELFWALISASRIELDGVANSLIVARDISARKAAEEQMAATAEALRASEIRYRTAFQTSYDGISLSRLQDGRIIDVNEMYLRTFGLQREQVLGRTSQEIGIWTDPEDRPRIVEMLGDATAFRDHEVQFQRANGERFWAMVSASRCEVDAEQCMLSVIHDISKRKADQERVAAAMEALRASEQVYHTVFDTCLDALALSEVETGKYVEVNQGFLDISGWLREEVLGRTSIDLDVWADPEDRTRLLEILRDNGKCHSFECRLRRKSKDVLWGLLSASTLVLNGTPCILSLIRDISSAKAAEEKMAVSAAALQASEERYRTAFQTSLDAFSLSHLDDGYYLDINQAFLDMLGYQRDEVLGWTSVELNLWKNPEDRKRLVEALNRGVTCRELEFEWRKKDGNLFWVTITATRMEMDGIPALLAVIRDVSGAKAAAEEIKSLAFYDPLTRLPNRRLLLDRLQQSQAFSARSTHRHALLFVDLDSFKTLNDTMGHHIGDLLLLEVARRMLECVRKSDTVGRLGGDEFIVILEELSKNDTEAASQARLVAEKILGAIAEPYILAGHPYRSSASIGIAVFGGSDTDSSEILRQADIAMYQAKSLGRGNMHFFAPVLQAAVNARATMVEDLRMAIAREEFELFFQPQLDRTNVISCEALVRWNHPTRGLVAPNHFIPLAEETGQILALGAWVLEAVCRQLAAWSNDPEMANMTISANISALQFRQPGFAEKVLAELQLRGVDPRRLCLELTESTLLDSVDETVLKIAELKSYGISFSLDDFGTGFSSLSYLKRLPIDQLKIDRSFIHDIQLDASSAAIVQAIVTLGRAIGLMVIAEGVESSEQRDFLDRLGCHGFQGYYFSPPLPLAEFERCWRNHGRVATT